MTPEVLAALSTAELERRFASRDGLLPFAILHTGEAPAHGVGEYEALRTELQRRRVEASRAAS